MGSRVGFWADDELDKRLDDLVEAMQKAPAYRELDITKSAIIKSALRRGLPFMEFEQGVGPLTRGEHNPTIIATLDMMVVEALDFAERLGFKLPHYEKRKKK
jgi:predicted transcriptional regulator